MVLSSKKETKSNLDFEVQDKLFSTKFLKGRIQICLGDVMSHLETRFSRLNFRFYIIGVPRNSKLISEVLFYMCGGGGALKKSRKVWMLSR